MAFFAEPLEEAKEVSFQALPASDELLGVLEPTVSVVEASGLAENGVAIGPDDVSPEFDESEPQADAKRPVMVNGTAISKYWRLRVNMPTAYVAGWQIKDSDQLKDGTETKL